MRWQVAAARGMSSHALMPRAIAQSRDRLCTVSRTVALGEPIEFDQVQG